MNRSSFIKNLFMAVAVSFLPEILRPAEPVITDEEPPKMRVIEMDVYIYKQDSAHEYVKTIQYECEEPLYKFLKQEKDAKLLI